jgi:hypothetical protein
MRSANTTVALVMHPVGPRTSRVYWFRRVAVAVLAVLVVAGVVWFVIDKAYAPQVSTAADTGPTTTSQMTGVLRTSTIAPDTSDATAGPTTTSHSPAGSSQSANPANSQRPGGASTHPTTTAARPTGNPATTSTVGQSTATHANQTTKPASTTKTAPTTKAAPTTQAAATSKTAPPSTSKTTPPTTSKTTPTSTSKPPPPPPSTDAQGRLICPDAAIHLTATTVRPAFAVGDQPILGMTVTNTGSVPCVRDLSGGLQVFTVYTAGGNRIWSTADCFPGTGRDIRELGPGQSVSYLIKWSGTTSSPGCTAPRTAVPAGHYQLITALGLLKSAPTAFAIMG